MASLIWNSFQFHELTEIVRQKDAAFAELLNETQIKKQKNSHMLTKCCKLMNYNLWVIIHFTQSMYFMCMHQSEDARHQNSKMLNNLDGDLYTCKALDSVRDKKM